MAESLRVAVADTRTGDSFEPPARCDTALDVFYHPFAYATRAAAPAV